MPVTSDRMANTSFTPAGSALQHYGLTLNDTPFSDETVIKEHIDAGISLADAVNFLVENTNWFASIVRGLAGKNSRLLLLL